MATADDLAGLIAEDLKLRSNLRSLRGIAEDVQSAYEIQDRLHLLLGACCGRKIAMNASALMQMAGITEPIYGHVIGQSPFANGTTLSHNNYEQLAVEPEFAAVLSKDVLGGSRLIESDLCDVIDCFHMAFEILDKRNGATDMFAPTFIANNVLNAGCVLGDKVSDSGRLQSGNYHAVFANQTQNLLDGQQTAPQNPFEACLLVINHFSQRGHTLLAGEIILCGAHYPPIDVKPESDFAFSLGTGEQVSLSISD